MAMTRAIIQTLMGADVERLPGDNGNQEAGVERTEKDGAMGLTDAQRAQASKEIDRMSAAWLVQRKLQEAGTRYLRNACAELVGVPLGLTAEPVWPMTVEEMEKRAAKRWYQDSRAGTIGGWNIPAPSIDAAARRRRFKANMVRLRLTCQFRPKGG